MLPSKYHTRDNSLNATSDNYNAPARQRILNFQQLQRNIEYSKAVYEEPYQGQIPYLPTAHSSGYHRQSIPLERRDVLEIQRRDFTGYYRETEFSQRQDNFFQIKQSNTLIDDIASGHSFDQPSYAIYDLSRGAKSIQNTSNTSYFMDNNNGAFR